MFNLWGMPRSHYANAYENQFDWGSNYTVIYTLCTALSHSSLFHPFPSPLLLLPLSYHTEPSLHVLLFEQLPVHKVNLSLLRNSTLIFEIDKHFCVLQLGVAGGRRQGARGLRSKVAHFRLPFFLLLLPLLPPRFPISSRNHLFLLLYCEGSGRVMDRREAGGQGDSLFLLCDLLLLCHRRVLR